MKQNPHMNIHALLVAINNYNEIPRLRGCVSDIEKVASYLYQSGAPCIIEKLLDSNATKSAIEEAFSRITQNIDADDTFLLYYAGHGTQEEADPIWNETDNLLECIVCYDENPNNPADYLLCDKELRYLIYELSRTGCHIVTIFDCCHSGDNTRNAFVLPYFSAYDINERRVYNVFPKRGWQDFIFHNKIKREDIINMISYEFLPQGRHVQIAACESDESAIEVKGEGVFTKTLLKVLADTGGNISYHDLRGRIRQYLRFVFEQQPRIYTAASSEEVRQQMLYDRFLNNQYINEQVFITEAVYNQKKGWLLNLGAIHGINRDTNVSLLDPVSPEKFYRATIKEIFLDYSSLFFPDDRMLAPNYTVLKAAVEGIELYPLKLHIKRHEGNPEKLKIIADVLFDGASGHYVLAEEEISADYSLHVTPGLIYITHPEEQFRPVVQPIEFNEADPDNHSVEQGIKQLIDFLKHISRWHYIKILQNKDVHSLKSAPVAISIEQVFEDGTEKVLPVNSVAGTDHTYVQAAVKSCLRISLTNGTSQKLFVGVAYLSYNFQVYLHLLERKVELLQPGESVSLGIRSGLPNGTKIDQIPLQLPDVIREYNWHDYTETIRIIISKEEFNMEALNLAPLPLAYTLKTRMRSKSAGSLRSMIPDAEENVVEIKDWMVQTMNLKYPNIFYNGVGLDDINQMIDWDKMEFFARGLYKHKQGVFNY